MQSEVEEEHVFPSRPPLPQRSKLASHDPNFPRSYGHDYHSVGISLVLSSIVQTAWARSAAIEGVDTRSSSVNTRDLLRKPVVPIWDSVSTLDQVVSTLEAFQKPLLG
ncbi:hypothetical protein Taro_037569 [Colocasia esculenta]|uniref:Uncharacterized protein n=1 Tax=Colocasia esculenta TaxID=4460 RepID=A0A843WL57_COLES|nr:hypothetical protein [Colocasia esculenta]